MKLLKVVQKSFICLYTVFPSLCLVYSSVICQSVVIQPTGGCTQLESSNESFFEKVEEEKENFYEILKCACHSPSMCNL